MTPESAKTAVKRLYPELVIEWCVPYKSSFVVMAHPNNGPEDREHGAYPDPFYVVDKLSERVRPFVPAFEPDLGQSFFAAVKTQFTSRQT